MASDQQNQDEVTLLKSTELHEDDLTEEAKTQFAYHVDILNTFQSYRQSVLRNEFITDYGRIYYLNDFHTTYTNCKYVLNYAAEHHKFRDQNLPTVGPLILCGLLRTGTTLLYNLLACDPNCRAPLYTDMTTEVVPPIARSNSIAQKRRIDVVNSMRQNTGTFTHKFTRITASHAQFPIEEDFCILRQAGYFSSFVMLSDNEDSDAESWIRNEINKGYAYDYHETFIRMLNSVDAPKSHWLLKTPLHVFRIDQLLQHYPNALLIMTHRPLDEVLPSLYRLTQTIAEGNFDETNEISRERIKKRCRQFFDTSVESIMKFRTCENGSLDQTKRNIFDVSYESLMKDPISIVHQIYDYFNLQWSDEFETAMRNWLEENPQGKQGRHTYTLTEFGLEREDIQARYADYTRLFLASTSSDN